MGLFDPLYIFVAPFILLVTIPLAILAGLTTMLAFAVLLFRVFVVYLDLALTLVPEYLSIPPSAFLFRSTGSEATATAGVSESQIANDTARRREQQHLRFELLDSSSTATPAHRSGAASGAGSPVRSRSRRSGASGGSRSPAELASAAARILSGFGTTAPDTTSVGTTTMTTTTTAGGPGFVAQHSRRGSHSRSRRPSSASAASLQAGFAQHADDLTDRLRGLPSSSTISSGSTSSSNGAVDGTLGLTPSIGIARDYEGIGGWRVDDDGVVGRDATEEAEEEEDDGNRDDGSSDADDAERRFELIRNHHVTPSSDELPPTQRGMTNSDGGGLMMKGSGRGSVSGSSDGRTRESMSPNSSRVRAAPGGSTGHQFAGGFTPVDAGMDESYFTLSGGMRPGRKVTV